MRPRRRHDPAKVREWLALLAHYLDRTPVVGPYGPITRPSGYRPPPGNRDFRWWGLAPVAVPKYVLAAMFALAGVALGVAAAAAIGYGLNSVMSPGPPVDLVNVMQNVAIILGIVGWFVGLGKHEFVDLPSARPRPLLARDMLISALGGGVGGLGAGVGLLLGGQSWDAAALGLGVGAGLACGMVMRVLTRVTGPDIKSKSTPYASWCAARNAGLICLVTFPLAGTTLGVFPVRDGSLASGVLGFAVGLVAGVLTERRRFLVHLATMGYLAARGWMPLRLMAFLDDAHRIGLLRAVGPIYQFRHAEFQDHLAAGSRPISPPPEYAARVGT